jgi:hypothetical protein
MASEGSLPDMPDTSVPMRAVVAAASTTNPDAEAKTQQLAQQAGMGVDLTHSDPQAAQQRATMVRLFRNRETAAGGRRQNFCTLFWGQCYTIASVRAEPGVSSNSPNQARFCQWSLRFIQRNSIQEIRTTWNKVL